MQPIAYNWKILSRAGAHATSQKEPTDPCPFTMELRREVPYLPLEMSKMP